MFSEQFFDLLLNFGDDWKVDDVKVNFNLEEVDIFVIYIGKKLNVQILWRCAVFMTTGLLAGGVIWTLCSLLCPLRSAPCKIH